MRILGVDPGLTRCGVGVVDSAPGRRVTLVAAGVIRTPITAPIGHRLLGVDQGLAQWLVRYQPDAIAVERVFAQHNHHTVMGTAQAAGIAILAATKASLPVALHTPSEVKAAVTGNGRADKAQVSAMVRRILSLDELPGPADTADALAIAITELWRPSAVSPHSGISDDDGATPAQKAWTQAEALAKQRRRR